MTRMMLFGDSHLVALKDAAASTSVPDGVELNFWGSPGTRWREIALQDGKIVPQTEEARNAFAKFSTEGLSELDPSAYDIMVVVGARVRPGAVMPDILNTLVDPERFVTRGYVKAALAEQLKGYNAYQIARDIAASDGPEVWINPVPLATFIRGQKIPAEYLIAAEATEDHIRYLWGIIEEILREDNIRFIPQPIHTVAHGFYTHGNYRVEGDDIVHKNAKYGARILDEIFRIYKERVSKEQAPEAENQKSDWARALDRVRETIGQTQ